MSVEGKVKQDGVFFLLKLLLKCWNDWSMCSWPTTQSADGNKRAPGGGLKTFYTYTRHVLRETHKHTHTLKIQNKALTGGVWTLQDGLMLIFPVHKTNRVKPKQTAVGPSFSSCPFLFPRPAHGPIACKHSRSEQEQLYSALKNKDGSAFVHLVKLLFPCFNYKYTQNIFTLPVS